jgi:aspartokinase-like uncharacterized kinase
MALDDADLAEIGALLGAGILPGEALTELRRRFPAMTVTRCDPSDVDTEIPFKVWPALSLYLVDAADHCWRLTSDAARATGLVLVEHPVVQLAAG